MKGFLNIPLKIVRLFVVNTADREIAWGVCVAMFLGFLPLNGPMAAVFFILLFVLKVNRLASVLVLPAFKLLYLLGVSALADLLGGVLLINAKFLAGFWGWLTHLPLAALLNLNNTIVAGGLILSLLLAAPLYFAALRVIALLRKTIFDKIKNTAFVKWLLKLPLVEKAISLTDTVKDGLS
jgi:uncharacterized protein (TIGR03546 family)